MNQIKEWISGLTPIIPIIVAFITAIIPIFINLLIRYKIEKDPITLSSNREIFDNLYLPISELFNVNSNNVPTMRNLIEKTQEILQRNDHLVSDSLYDSFEAVKWKINAGDITEHPIDIFMPFLKIFYEEYHTLRSKLGYPCSVAIKEYAKREKRIFARNIYFIVLIINGSYYIARSTYTYVYLKQIPSHTELISAIIFIVLFIPLFIFNKNTNKSMRDRWLIEHYARDRYTEIFNTIANNEMETKIKNYNDA